jgi:hypothetical protein
MLILLGFCQPNVQVRAGARKPLASICFSPNEIQSQLGFESQGRCTPAIRSHLPFEQVQPVEVILGAESIASR